MNTGYKVPMEPYVWIFKKERVILHDCIHLNFVLSWWQEFFRHASTQKYHIHISFLKKEDTHKSTLAKRKLH